MVPCHIVVLMTFGGAQRWGHFKAIICGRTWEMAIFMMKKTVTM